MDNNEMQTHGPGLQVPWEFCIPSSFTLCKPLTQTLLGKNLWAFLVTLTATQRLSRLLHTHVHQLQHARLL